MWGNQELNTSGSEGTLPHSLWAVGSPDPSQSNYVMLPGTQDAILLLPGDPTMPRASGGHLRGARAHVAKTPGSNGLRSPGLEESEVAATHVDCREAVGIGVSPSLVLWNQNKMEVDPTHGRPGPQTFTCEILDPSFHSGRTV